MTPLPRIEGGFACILADPPWRFTSNSEARPGRNSMAHYACMRPAEIAALPVAGLVANDAWLFLWITGPFLAIGAHRPILKAWGFKPSGMGFDWIKTRPRATGPVIDVASDLFMGGGFTTRKNAEYVVIGRRGRPARRAADVRSTIISPVREHSRKPDEIYERIERLVDGPRLELFARQTRPGWVSWGNETTKFDGATA